MEQDLGEIKVGFIGAGKMAHGIAQGILLSGKVCPGNVMVSAPSLNNLGKFKDCGVRTTHCNTEVVRVTRVLFLAVKPHIIPSVLQEVSAVITPQHIIISVAAGVTVATLERLLPTGSMVLRLMPNLPCVVQEGALLFCRGTRAGPGEAGLLRELLASCGLVEEGPEAFIDIHTGLSGSGVAYGAGRLLRDSGQHPAQLRADVCTPGGTTIFGLHALERGGLRAAAMGAVEAATERARELGGK
ncbi:pyrroline-5-carboxylate reductase 3 isoform X2 [Acipenser ruthenus]|uniref:pyrroline-5-carboxylate reductase 3 isoform X2 n=1 Tax=Acipenser ruthenus TaxID=7906 RepID=UPI00145B6282|nr:pyrroline-5-carboxylate reductase 3 isoform X2 [Acipenser ruthenus]